MRFRTTIFIVLAFGPSQLFSATTDFPRTLKVGMSGDDVKALQIFMNKDPETRVADSGAGSSGNETTYFGLATKRALVKFQNKYKKEILEPVGLTFGTGVAGVYTRIVLNKTSEKSGSTLTPANPSTDTSAKDAELFFKEHPVITVDLVMKTNPPLSVFATTTQNLSQISRTALPTINYISDINIAPRGKLTIYGTGFTASTIVHFGDTVIPNITIDPTKGEISFVIPQVSGIFLVSVENKNGDSKNETPIFTLVSDTVKQPGTPTKADSSNGEDLKSLVARMNLH